METMELNDLFVCSPIPKSNFPERSTSWRRVSHEKRPYSPKNKQRLMFRHLTWSMAHWEMAWMINMTDILESHFCDDPSFCVCNGVTLWSYIIVDVCNRQNFVNYWSGVWICLQPCVNVIYVQQISMYDTYKMKTHCTVKVYTRILLEIWPISYSIFFQICL